MAPRTVEAIPASSFAAPLLYRGSLPLRVAVYGVVAAAIRNGTLPPSSLLPPEADVAAAFEVSRTVMREALILLEEDGLIRTQRGVGRFVADKVPEIGLEAIQPIELMLRTADSTVGVARLGHEPEPATDFTRRWLGLAPEESSWMWESLVSSDGEPVALAQEWVAEPSAAGAVPVVAGLLQGREQDPRSMLSILQQTLGASIGPAVCHISLTKAGNERAQVLKVRPTTSVLVLTQAVSRDGVALYVAKYLIKPEAGQLTVIQG